MSHGCGCGLNAKSVLPIAIIFVLIASTLFGVQSVRFANADIYPPPSRFGIIIYWDISSPNGSYAQSAIPLTVDLLILYGTAPISPEISVQNVTCMYSLDNAEWKNISFIKVISSRVDSWPLYQQMVHEINCTYSTTLQGLSEGLHFINVTVKSDGDSWGTSQVYFTVDSPPVISVLSPQNKTYNANSLPLDFTVDQPASWIGYSLDGQGNVTITGNTTITGLTKGSHNITVYAKDTLENTGTSETIGFSVEVPEPFPTVLVATASGASAVIVGIGLLIYFRKRNQ